MTTKTMLIALALAATAFGTTTLLSGSASAGGFKAQGPALTASAPSQAVPTAKPGSVIVRQFGREIPSPVNKMECLTDVFGRFCNY
jgi:hypothetical protein